MTYSHTETICRENFDTDAQYTTARKVAASVRREMQMLQSPDTLRLSPTALMLCGGAESDRAMVLRQPDGVGRRTSIRGSAVLLFHPDGSASVAALDTGILATETVPGHFRLTTLTRWMLDGPPAMLDVVVDQQSVPESA